MKPLQTLQDEEQSTLYTFGLIMLGRLQSLLLRHVASGKELGQAVETLLMQSLASPTIRACLGGLPEIAQGRSDMLFLQT